ncbi:MAG TPA: energy transducer TonB, partial [Candidatus Didemnitutus sp.]|nr:energy transducer TonB [Candidatus Didemnitutus sp.]
MSVRVTHIAVGLVVLSTLVFAQEPVLFGRAVVETKDMEQLTKYCLVVPPQSIPVVDSVLPSTFSFTLAISEGGIRPVDRKTDHPSILFIAKWYADRCVLKPGFRGETEVTFSCKDSVFGKVCRFFTDVNLAPNQLAWNHPEPPYVPKGPGAEKLVGVKVEPSYDSSALARSIVYPIEASQNGISGMVLVGALISKTGCIEKLKIIESDNEMLNQSALDAVGRQTFTPALVNGKPIRVWVRVPIRY